MNEKDLNENIQATNKLLLDMVQNQKEGNKNLAKSFIATVICMTIIIVTMVVGYLIYESNFEIIDTTEKSSITQDADVVGDGAIYMNNGGDFTYGSESETNDN